MSRQATCEERIESHLRSRMDGIAAAFEIVTGAPNVEEADLSERAREILSERGIDTDDTSDSDIEEAARDYLRELPLGVSAKTVFRIDLSTGGPGDWLEVECSGDTPNYEPAGEGEHYEITGVEYHFNDWFDHAQRTLRDDDLERAEAFAREVIPELIE